MKCRFRGLADRSHVKQVHVECKANKETAPARGPWGRGGGGVVTRRRNTDGGGGGGGSTFPPLGLFGTANGELSFVSFTAPALRKPRVDHSHEVGTASSTDASEGKIPYVLRMDGSKVSQVSCKAHGWFWLPSTAKMPSNSPVGQRLDSPLRLRTRVTKSFLNPKSHILCLSLSFVPGTTSTSCNKGGAAATRQSRLGVSQQESTVPLRGYEPHEDSRVLEVL